MRLRLSSSLLLAALALTLAGCSPDVVVPGASGGFDPSKQTGGSSGTPEECGSSACDDANPCTKDACDEPTNLCEHDPLPEGTSCAAGSGVCDAGGVCVPLAPLLWRKQYGGAIGGERGSAIAVDAAGDVVVAGTFHGTVDFGAGPVTTAADALFMMKIDAYGEHIWSKTFDASIDKWTVRLAIDPAGDIVLAGDVVGAVDLGGGPLPPGAPESRDLFAAKFDSAGKHLWSKRFPEPTAGVETDGIAVDPTGDVLVFGHAGSGVDFGGGGDPAGVFQHFLVKLDPGGGYLWDKRFPAPSTALLRLGGVAADDAGNVIVTALFHGPFDLGGEPLGSGYHIIKFDTSGNYLWARSHDGQSRAIAAGPSGQIAVAGVFYGDTLELGDATLVGHENGNLFLAGLDGDGDFTWSKYAGSGDASLYPAITIDGGGNVITTGFFLGEVDFGGGELAGSPDGAVFLAKLDHNGGFVWASGFGHGAGRAVAVDGAGNVYCTGDFNETIDFGTGPITSAGLEDIFIAKFAP